MQGYAIISCGIAILITKLLLFLIHDYELDFDVQLINDKFTTVANKLPVYEELKLLLEQAAEKDLLGCYKKGNTFVIDTYSFVDFAGRKVFKVYRDNTLVYDESEYASVDEDIQKRLYSYIDYLRRIHENGY